MKQFLRDHVIDILQIAIAVACLCVFLTGCFKTERETQGTQQQRREYQETGTQAGQPYSKNGIETTVTETLEKEVTKTGLDPEAVKQIAGALSGAVMEAIAPQLSAITGALPKSLTGSDKLDHMLELIAALMATKATTKGGAHVLGKLRRKQV